MKTHLFFTKNLQEAQSEIESHLGHVGIICTQNIFLANLPDHFDPTNLVHSMESIPEEIDPLSKLYADAWKLDSNKEEDEIFDWGTEGFQHPKNAYNDPELAKQEEIFPPATSDYLIGKVAVGIIVVSGIEPHLNFSSKEYFYIIKQITLGLQVLVDFESMAKITFYLNTKFVPIEAEDSPNCDQSIGYEPCEKIWRDPALKALGFQPGLNGVKDYNFHLIDTMKTKWAYTAFFTKYTLKHFAYACCGRLCINYYNDGWEPQNIYKVFAHESCHIFGAADEYKVSNCTCEPSGKDSVPNYNCNNCSDDSHPSIRFSKTSCLMKKNDPSVLCQWSRGQLGWNFSYSLTNSINKGPAICVFQDALYLFYTSKVKDSLTNEIVEWRTSQDGYNWSIPSSAPGVDFVTAASTFKPSIFPSSDSLLVAYRNDHAKIIILEMKGSTGSKILGANTGQETKDSPAICAYYDNSYIFFRSIDKTNRLLVSSSSFDFTRNIIVNDAGSIKEAPAVCLHNNRMYVTFTSSKNKILVFWAIGYENGTLKTSPIYNTLQTSNNGPSIYSFNGKLYISFRNTDGKIQIISSTDGESWSSPPLMPGQTTSQGPAIGAFKGNLFAAFKGNHSNLSLINFGQVFNT